MEESFIAYKYYTCDEEELNKMQNELPEIQKKGNDLDESDMGKLTKMMACFIYDHNTIAKLLTLINEIAKHNAKLLLVNEDFLIVFNVLMRNYRKSRRILSTALVYEAVFKEQFNKKETCESILDVILIVLEGFPTPALCVKFIECIEKIIAIDDLLYLNGERLFITIQQLWSKYNNSGNEKFVKAICSLLKNIFEKKDSVSLYHIHDAINMIYEIVRWKSTGDFLEDAFKTLDVLYSISIE